MNAEKVLPEYLALTGIDIDKHYCEQLILSHPDYPSILSLSDTLKILGINYQVYNIENKNKLDIVTPCLLHTTLNGGTMLLIKNQYDWVIYKEEIEHWSGIMLKAESGSKITNTVHEEVLKKNKQNTIMKFIICIIGIILFIILNIYSFELSNKLLILTSAIGIFVGYLLVAKEVGINYRGVETFCNVNSQTSCNRVLNSKGATLFGLIKVSEVVLAYFAAQMLFLLISNILINESQMIILTIRAICIFAIPAILISTWYQYSIVKSWCKLCLIVSGILFLQMSISLTFYNQYTNLFTFSILSYAIIFSLVFSALTIAISLIKQDLVHRRDLTSIAMEALRVKNSSKTFGVFLAEEKANDFINFDYEIGIGNRDSPIQIIMVTNLYCAPCKEKFALLNQVLNIYPDDVRINFRFVLNNSDLSKKVPAVQHLLTYWLEKLYGTIDESVLTHKLIHDWFALMNLDLFSKAYPIIDDVINASCKELVEKHYNWNRVMGTHSTPAFFINGSKLPNNYSIEDLVMIIPGLLEEIEVY